MVINVFDWYQAVKELMDPVKFGRTENKRHSDMYAATGILQVLYYMLHVICVPALSSVFAIKLIQK